MSASEPPFVASKHYATSKTRLANRHSAARQLQDDQPGEPNPPHSLNGSTPPRLPTGTSHSVRPVRHPDGQPTDR